MKTIKPLLILLLSCLSLLSESSLEQIVLWPKQAPGFKKGEIGPESKSQPKPGQSQVIRIQNVTQPMITIYPATPNHATGATVIVCPGGGYNILAYEHEGTEVCEWLNKLGITGVLLKYRVPRRANRPKHEAPLQDVQRAMGILRKNARKWDIDPKRIGILGFSAGGNLAMMALTSHQKRSYAHIDEADNFSCRPDFGILIYPAYLVDRVKRDLLFPEVQITQNTPPCFFAHTGDDHVPAEGSVLAYLELEKAGVQGNELHVFPFGGHGYGMRVSQNPVSQWPARAESWMRANSWIPKENK